MTASELVRRQNQHRAWVTRNLLEVARGLSQEQLRQPFGVGQGSVWRSLLHLYAAEYVWREVLDGRESSITPGDVGGKLPGNQEGEGAITTLEELASRWAELDSRWDRWLAELTDAGLDQKVSHVSTRGPGTRFFHNQADVALHVCMHAHYTAAQVVNMYRQLGVGLPETMLIMLSRIEQM